MHNTKSMITSYTTGQSCYATGQDWGCPVSQLGNMNPSCCATSKSEAVPFPSQAICGCPVTQQDNIRLPAQLSNWTRLKLSCCTTGQKRGCPVMQQDNIRLPSCLTDKIEAILLCNWAEARLSHWATRIQLIEAILLRDKHIKAFLYHVPVSSTRN